jgi:hypothetical protein
MTEKELEKHNFLTWCRYATTKDIEKAKGGNSEVCERLYSEYSDEIKIIDKTRHLYESISQHAIGIQKYDLSLKISI